jgi:hypothetical protein
MRLLLIPINSINFRKKLTIIAIVRVEKKKDILN